MKCSQRIVLIVIIVSVLAAAFSGCGTKKQTADSSEDTMTIQWLGIPYFGSAVAGENYAQKVLEEKFNVKLDPIFLDTESYKNRKPILLASGDIPDVIYEMDPGNIQADVRQGFIAEIPYELLYENTPDIFNEINKVVPQVWLYSYYEGKNYGIPNIGYAGSNPKVGMWRGDWLKKVGINKAPETIDEMHTALYKLTHEDPDGNGQNDTYGMSGDIKAWYLSFTDLFCAYGVLPFDWMKSGNGVVYGGLRDETKQVLALLRDWYKEGLIDPDFIMDDVYKSGLDKFKNGQVGYINCGASYIAVDNENPASAVNVMKKINPDAEILPSQPVVGPNGDSGTFAWGKGGHIVAFGKHMENEDVKLKKILEILEYQSKNQDFNLGLRVGLEGEHFEFLNKELSYKGGIKALPPYDDKNTANKYLITTTPGSYAFFAPITLKQQTLNSLKLEKEAEFEKKYIDEAKGRVDVFLKPDSVSSASQYLEDLRNKQLVYMSEIIRGEKTVDQYDEFVSVWNNEGGKVLEADANQLYADLEKISSAIAGTGK